MKKTTETNYLRPLILLMICSTVLRGIIAAFTELGNDEVYYRIFGIFPSLSYFDHAPMVAWLINLTTAGSAITSEFLVRLSSILIGTANTYIIYRIAGRGRTGFIAALLLTGSIYASLIVGTFIMPDTPLSLFWLLSLLMFKEILLPNQSETSAKSLHTKMLLAGVAVGLAMLSKYTGAYLWAAAAVYILIFNRKWLIKWSLYVAPLVSLIIFLPVLVWNYQNEFISFTFHSARVAAESSINWLYFGREIFGGIFYNNPINFVIIICAVVAYLKGRHYVNRSEFFYLLIFSLPLIAVFLFISLNSETLPHWAAPAYFALIILAAKYLDTLKKGIRWGVISVSFATLICVVGFIQINWGVIPLSANNLSASKLGRNDITLDMYGWEQLGEEFAKVVQEDRQVELIGDNPLIINYRWDEAAHLDTYVALPNGLDLITLGDLIDTHFYQTITQKRGGIEQLDRRGGYFVVSSRYFADDIMIFSKLGLDPKKVDHTITINRAGNPVVNFFVYRVAAVSF